jgi:protein-arginine kinase activator protein McsA
MSEENNEDFEDNEKRQGFYIWMSSEPIIEEKELTVKQQIKIANKRRLKAVKKEKYLKAAMYRDIIKNLKKQL